MTAFPMSTEIIMLGCAIALVLLQLVLQASSGAMGLSIGHCPNACGVNRFCRLDVEQACNRAHGSGAPRCIK